MDASINLNFLHIVPVAQSFNCHKYNTESKSRNEIKSPILPNNPHLKKNYSNIGFYLVHHETDN